MYKTMDLRDHKCQRGGLGGIGLCHLLCLLLNLTFHGKVSNIIPILQREPEVWGWGVGFVQGLPTGLWKSWGSNPCQFVSQALAATVHYFKPPYFQLAWMKVAWDKSPSFLPLPQAREYHAGWGCSHQEAPGTHLLPHLRLWEQAGSRHPAMGHPLGSEDPRGWSGSGPEGISPATTPHSSLPPARQWPQP